MLIERQGYGVVDQPNAVCGRVAVMFIWIRGPKLDDPTTAHNVESAKGRFACRQITYTQTLGTG